MNNKLKTKTRTWKRSACSGSCRVNVGDLGVISPRILNQGDFGQLLTPSIDPLTAKKSAPGPNRTGVWVCPRRSVDAVRKTEIHSLTGSQTSTVRHAVSLCCEWATTDLHLVYYSVSQPLWDRGPVNSFFIWRGPGPNKYTRKYLSRFFLSSYVKLA